MLDSILQDVRYGARSLRRSPGFTVVAVLSIAGGLAAGTAIFAAVNGFALRPIGGGGGAGLHSVFTGSRRGGPYGSSSFADFRSFMEARRVIAAGCASTRERATLAVDGNARVHHGEIVSPGCLTVVGIRPALGRFPGESDATVSGPTPLVIGHGVWRRRFGGDVAAIGRTVQLNGASVVVVGVAPASFAGLSLDGGADFWAPIQVAPVVLGDGIIEQRRHRAFRILVRLQEGVSAGQAEAALGVIAAGLRQLDPPAWTTERGTTRTVTVLSEADARFAGAPKGALAAMIAAAVAAVIIIVAIACVNLATMVLARGAARSREFSIRLALGASRARLLRQMATESLLVAAMGVTIALAAVAAGVAVFEARRPTDIPAFDLAMDWRVIAFAMTIAAGASLLFGLLPAVHTLRHALVENMKGVPAIARARGLRIGARDALILVQVSVSVALLSISALFGRALLSGASQLPGFDPNGVATLAVNLDALAGQDWTPMTERLLAAGRLVPGVDRLTLGGVVPVSGSNIGFEVAPVGGAPTHVYGNVVAPGYFSTLRIPMHSGRDFDARDRQGGPRAAIINEALARSMFGSPNAVGRSFISDSQRVTVIAVVANTRYRAMAQAYRPLLYLPVAQTPSSRYVLHARGRIDGPTLAALERTLRTVDGRIAIEPARSMRAHMDQALIGERVMRMVGAAIGALQLALAMMALWGLVAYNVSRRTSEMGIRLALGATPAGLVRLIVRPAGRLIAAGVLIGSIAGAAIARVVQSQSSGLPPLDLLAGFPVAVSFTLVALTAAWWPARRAGMADPARSLRAE